MTSYEVLSLELLTHLVHGVSLMLANTGPPEGAEYSDRHAKAVAGWREDLMKSLAKLSLVNAPHRPAARVG